MSPGRNLADGDGLGNSTSDRLEETTRTLIPEKSSSKTNVTNDDDTKTSSTSRINSADHDNENSCLLRSTQTENIGTINRSERADSTATDDSGIAAEFDSSYQNVTDDDDDDDDDDESVLGNSLGSNHDKKQTEGDAVKSDCVADSCVASTSSTRLHLSHLSSTEDSPSSSPRKTCSSPRAAGASWSPRRGSATDIIAERRRKRKRILH